jgi:hypothetical protein
LKKLPLEDKRSRIRFLVVLLIAILMFTIMPARLRGRDFQAVLPNLLIMTYQYSCQDKTPAEVKSKIFKCRKRS